MHERVAAYLDCAPQDQQSTLRALRQLIVAELPQAEESFESGFPVYKLRGGWVAGFATRKQGPMLYIMRAQVLDAAADVLGTLRTGKSCLVYRPTEALSAAALEMLARKMLREAGET